MIFIHSWKHSSLQRIDDISSTQSIYFHLECHADEGEKAADSQNTPESRIIISLKPIYRKRVEMSQKCEKKNNGMIEAIK